MKMGRLLAAWSMAVVALAIVPRASAAPAEVEKVFDFDEPERRLLKRIFAADQYMKDMVKAHAFMSSINNVLSAGAPGPVKLPFKWNNKDATCVDLLFPIVNQSPNADFFEMMREARGCGVD
jgi:hypothetical protein